VLPLGSQVLLPQLMVIKARYELKMFRISVHIVEINENKG
jgi:hypothetical protein